MSDNVNQPGNNNELIERKKKWKKTERITLAIDLVLLLIFFVLSIVKQLTNFNSIAYYVLAVIFGVIILADLVILFISWNKLNRINSLITERGNDVTDSGKNI